jgi:hypothetical protein
MGRSSVIMNNSSALLTPHKTSIFSLGRLHRRAPWHSRGARVGCVVAAVCLSHSSVGRAQDSAAAAESLFNDAREAMAKKNFNQACAKFQESNRLDPAVGTLFNLANCEEQRGRLATAWTLFQQVIGKLAPGDPRLPIATDRSGALDARVPRLTIRARHEMPAGTVVNVAGLSLGAAALGSPLALNPGVYRISVFPPGKPVQLFSVTLAEGDAAEISVPADLSGGLPALANSSAGPGPARDSRTTGEDARDNAKMLAYVSGGVGAAALAVGIISGLIGLHKESIGDANCSDKTRTCSQTGYDANQSAGSLATVSTIGFAAGIVGIGLGSYFWLTLPDAKAGEVGVSHANGMTLWKWRAQW